MVKAGEGAVSRSPCTALEGVALRGGANPPVPAIVEQAFAGYVYFYGALMRLAGAGDGSWVSPGGRLRVVMGVPEGARGEDGAGEWVIELKQEGDDEVH